MSGKAKITDAFGLSAIIAWILLSAYFAWMGDGQFFQRMGAAGVAVAVSYFAFVQYGATPYPGMNERMALVSKTQVHQTRAVEQALVHTAINAREVNRLRDDLNLPPSEVCNNLSAPIVEGKLREPFDSEGFSEEIDNNLKTQGAADTSVERQRLFSEKLQMVLIVLATLQWGFGDVIIKQECATC